MKHIISQPLRFLNLQRLLFALLFTVQLPNAVFFIIFHQLFIIFIVLFTNFHSTFSLLFHYGHCSNWSISVISYHSGTVVIIESILSNFSFFLNNNTQSSSKTNFIVTLPYSKTFHDAPFPIV